MLAIDQDARKAISGLEDLGYIRLEHFDAGTGLYQYKLTEHGQAAGAALEGGD